MLFIRNMYCRAVQIAFRVALPFLPYRQPKIVSSCTKLCAVFQAEGIHSAMIVTDRGIVKNGLTEAVEDALHASDVRYTIYDRTQPNPTVDNVEEALTLYKENHCDAIIAIGGGSSMDCAKALGARAVYPKKRLGQMKGVLRALRRLPTLIAIPTTAGTGSEVTLAAIITDPQNKHKYALMSFPLIPRYAVLDPALTYSLPPHLTATTGMDALTHAVEAYIGRSTTKETRQLALEATHLIFENIEAAYADGRNDTARKNMLHAAYKAGIAFSESYVGYIHAIAHSLGGQYGTPHGLANAVIMPYILEAYGDCVYVKLHRLGIAAGICSEQEDHERAAKTFIAAIKELNRNMNIPDQLPGIRVEDIPTMARYADQEANPLYPVPKLMSRKELEKFYYQIGGIAQHPLPTSANNPGRPCIFRTEKANGTGGAR